MSGPFHDADRKTNIHAPWRIEYIHTLAEPDQGCFLCRARDQTDRDEDNLLLWRTPRCLVVMNRFPYTAGHLLIAPAGHVASMDDVAREVSGEMMELTRDCLNLLRRTIHAEGFNVGINIGRCAGAGLPDHLHLHVVPRWGGDTNFMAVLGDIRVVAQSLKELRQQLLRAGAEQGLPAAAHAP
jgi:ATP adenylyltransferase